MNEKEKLDYVKQEITGLKYLNLILFDAISFYQETKDLNPQFIYLNSIMENKFENILKIL